MAALGESRTSNLSGREASIPPAMDYASHQRTFRRFIHLLKWFVVHMALLLPALYFFIIGGQAIAGTVFLILAVAALGYGIVTLAEATRDL